MQNFLWQREGRDHAGAVTAMNARFFDVLHDCSDNGRLAVGDAIDIDLNGILEKAIDEHRTIRRYFDRAGHITFEIRLGIHQLHRAPAENETWPNEHWIAKFLRYRYGLFGACCRTVRRLAQPKLVQHGCE